MSDKLQLRGDSEQEWKLADPVIADREMVFSMDTLPIRFKIGNGVDKWSTLKYFAGLNGVDGINGKDGINGLKGDQGEAGKDGISTDHEAVVALQEVVKSIKEQPWTILAVLPFPTPKDVKFEIPLTRAGVLKTIDFYVSGVFGAVTIINVFRNGTSIGTQSITKLGKSTLTLATPLTAELDDLFSYSVDVDGLKGAVVSCNQKWVNR